MSDVMMEIPSRPYSKVKGSEPSVTTILDVKGTPGLDWAAAKLTAEYAVLEDTWKVDNGGAVLSPEDQINNLRRYFKGIWDGRAYMGTLTHKVMEAWAAGEVVELADLVNAHAPWTKSAEVFDVKVAEAQKYTNGLAAWWEDAEPTDCLTEQCVRVSGQYVGTRDLVCTINDERWLLDVKSTNHKWDPKVKPEKQKALYGDSWALQLAAYRYAREIVTYEWIPGTDSRGKPKDQLVVASVGANEPVDRCGIIHLRGDDTYHFYEIDARVDTYDTFLSLIPIYHWLKGAPAPILTELGGSL